MKSTHLVIVSALVLFVGIPLASAHVVVKPSEVGVAAFQTFTMGVPVEKDQPTIALRLLIPDGLNFVTPNVKPGWKIDVKKTGDGDSTKVTEIDWSGGQIPVGQRDDFVFSAQVPAQAGELDWKAYQTYKDGTVVNWDQDPKLAKSADDDSLTPYSKTQVVNDLVTPNPASSTAATTEANDQLARTVGWVALLIAALALGAAMRARRA